MTINPMPPDVARELAPTGRIRLAANMANASIIRQDVAGHFAGPVADLAGDLHRRTEVTVEIVPFVSGGAILAAEGAWDVAVLALDPSRRQLHYLHEIARVAATFIGRTAGLCAAADRPGVRIATARGAAYEAALLRSVRHAQIVSFDTPADARCAMMDGQCDFAAGIRATLAQSIAGDPEIQLMQDDFMVVSQALALPAAHRAATEFLAGLWSREDPP